MNTFSFTLQIPHEKAVPSQIRLRDETLIYSWARFSGFSYYFSLNFPEQT